MGLCKKIFFREKRGAIIMSIWILKILAKNGGSNNCGLYGILLKPLPSDLPEDLREMSSLIKREIILENPNVSFKDIPYYKYL